MPEIGPAERSPYHNVLVVKVIDLMDGLTAIERRTEQSPALYDAIARVLPATRTFEFQSTKAFKDGATSVILKWLPNLTGRTFHMRLHRRGYKIDLRTPEAERLFNDAAVAATTAAGTPARVLFTDPDAIIVIDTIDDRN